MEQPRKNKKDHPHKISHSLPKKVLLIIWDGNFQPQFQKMPDVSQKKMFFSHFEKEPFHPKT